MALINCEECGKEYSNKSPSCPNCACPTPSPEREKIEDLKNKIDNHMVPCSACGDWNSAGTSYCKNCGNMYTGLDYIEFDEKLKSEGLIKESEHQNNANMIRLPTANTSKVKLLTVKNILTVCLGILAFISFISIVESFQNSKAGTTMTVDSEELETEDPYIYISSSDLIDAFKENSVNSKQLYDKKLMAVTGKVGSVGETVRGRIYVTLDHDTEFVFVGIQCFAKDKETEDIIATLREGDIITVRGEGDNSSLSFSLEKATIDQ